MARKVLSSTFTQQIKEQLLALREVEQGYAALHVYVAGIAEPWEFLGQDEFEFHEGTGVLIVRDGPSDDAGRDNAEVPEYVFRLEAIVATQLV
jgi:hypothetical protein